MRKCLHCGVEKPESAYSTGRATCRICASERWYSPKTKNRIEDSPNWPWLRRLAQRRGRDGKPIVRYPEDVLQEGSL